MSAQDFGGFQAQPLDLQNQKNQRLFRILFLLMTVILILPVVIILMLLVSKGAPALSWAFFTENPVNGMTEGGIFPALVGTLWIVAVALIASVPLGVAAAIYLSEYASDNALTRAINWRSLTSQVSLRSCTRSLVSVHSSSSLASGRASSQRA